MRVAALYDVHGNLPALEAALREVRKRGADLVVVGGDVVPGPAPRETLDALLELPMATAFVRGNGERELLAVRSGIETGNVPERVLASLRWAADQLTEDQVSAVASWPLTHTADVTGLGPVLFCHATPRDDDEVVTRRTDPGLLAEVLAPVREPLVVCGHTHMQFDLAVGRHRLVNAGSVGMPWGAAGAHWLWLEKAVELVRTAYDLQAAAERIRASEDPLAEDFVASYVLDRPSEDDMLAAYGTG